MAGAVSYNRIRTAPHAEWKHATRFTGQALKWTIGKPADSGQTIICRIPQYIANNLPSHANRFPAARDISIRIDNYHSTGRRRAKMTSGLEPTEHKG